MEPCNIAEEKEKKNHWREYHIILAVFLKLEYEYKLLF